MQKDIFVYGTIILLLAGTTWFFVWLIFFQTRIEPPAAETPVAGENHISDNTDRDSNEEIIDETDHVIERFGASGEVVEVNRQESFLRIKDNNQRVYKVSIADQTEILRNRARILLSEIIEGERASAITSKNIKNNLEFEAESIYLRENPAGGNNIPIAPSG